MFEGARDMDGDETAGGWLIDLVAFFFLIVCLAALGGIFFFVL